MICGDIIDHIEVDGVDHYWIEDYRYVGLIDSVGIEKNLDNATSPAHASEHLMVREVRLFNVSMKHSEAPFFKPSHLCLPFSFHQLVEHSVILNFSLSALIVCLRFPRFST